MVPDAVNVLAHCLFQFSKGVLVLLILHRQEGMFIVASSFFHDVLVLPELRDLH